MQAMKAYGGLEVEPFSFWALTLKCDELLAPRSGRFNPKERAASNNGIGDWLDPSFGDTNLDFSSP